MKLTKNNIQDIAQRGYTTLIAKYGLTYALRIVKEINKLLKVEKVRRNIKANKGL